MTYDTPSEPSGAGSGACDDVDGVLQREECVGRHHRIAVRERRGHRPGGGRETGLPRSRVEPHHPVRAAPDPGQDVREFGGIVAVPTVGRDDDDRSAQQVPVMGGDHLGEGSGDACAPEPGAYTVVGDVDRLLHRPVPQDRRQTRRCGGEHEDLGRSGVRERTDEM